MFRSHRHRVVRRSGGILGVCVLAAVVLSGCVSFDMVKAMVDGGKQEVSADVEAGREAFKSTFTREIKDGFKEMAAETAARVMMSPPQNAQGWEREGKAAGVTAILLLLGSVFKGLRAAHTRIDKHKAEIASGNGGGPSPPA